MIRIADNPAVQAQIRQVPSHIGTSSEAEADKAREPDSPIYPPKSLVLEGERYYAVNTKK